MTTDWMSICAQWGRHRGASEIVGVLAAFGGAGGPDVRRDGGGAPISPRRVDSAMATLEQQAAADAVSLEVRIRQRLAGEVDGPQAAMFARRFQAVVGLLAQAGERAPAARVLRVGLVRRMAQVLAGASPHALRVRALVDFYYSQAALLHHRSPGAPPPQPMERLLSRLRWARVGPGVHHAMLTGVADRGPLRVNLLRLSGVRLEVVDCRRDQRRVPTGGGDPFAAYVASTGAVAAVSGGYFLYSEPDIVSPSRRTDPVGLLVQAGQVINPPFFRRASLLQLEGGGLRIQRVGMVGVRFRHPGEGWTPITAANDRASLGRGVVAFNRAWGRVSPESDGWSVSLVGRRVVSVRRGATPIPLAGCVICLPAGQPRGALPRPGESLEFRLPHRPAVVSGIAGGPLLLGAHVPPPAHVQGAHMPYDLAAEDFAGSAPPATFSSDETLDQNLLPRLAAGITGQGELLFAAIDGRNFHRAPGMNLRDTARLMHLLGCEVALNLDGGSSKRMVVAGDAVDLASTEVVASGGQPGGIRPVHSAILVRVR